MKELLLHYVWQHRLFDTDMLCTTDGRRVEVIDVGKVNTDAGPDFFNAKIKIDQTLWAGNVEIHTNSSVWEKHLHHQNKAYDNVILHVVENADCLVYRMDGEIIPQLELKFPTSLLDNYSHLITNKMWVPCAQKIHTVPSVIIQSWKNTLLTERLEQKISAINNLLETTNNHWEEAFYIIFARNFGFATNSHAFELLAKSLPLSVLARHKDRLLAVEAMLFGQAGFLNVDVDDLYFKELKHEYNFYKSKFSLVPIDASLWKLLRLRPVNFPYVRIAQFASIIHKSSKLFSKILENPTVENLSLLFECKSSSYWDNHYQFGSPTKHIVKHLGSQSIHSLIINTVVPFLFAYSTQIDDDKMKECAIQLLEQLPSEKNAIVTNWKELKISSNTAFDSQALLQLKNEYCDNKKCLRCRIGHKLLTNLS